MISMAVSEGLWGAGTSSGFSSFYVLELLSRSGSHRQCGAGESQCHKRNNFVKLPLSRAVLAPVGLNVCPTSCRSYPKDPTR